MYRFSFVETVGGRATEVTREMFHEIVKRDKIKTLCAQIAEGKTELKRSLPAFCWHAWFDEGKRKNYAAHPSGLIMLDIDHVADPKALFTKLFPNIHKGSLPMGEGGVKGSLLAAHVTPSTKGLRLVFPVPAGMDIVAAQTHYVKALKLKNVDACTKDLARLSFCVPEEYWLYVDEEGLFSPLPPPRGEEPIDSKVADTVVAELPAQQIAATQDGNPAPPIREEMPEGQSVSSYPEYYEAAQTLNSSPRGGREGVVPRGGKEGASGAIPYNILVESLQEQLGGVPAHGSRNNFIFSMAAYLRYVCNDDPEWIKAVLPTYGEAREKWARTIESACQRAQYKVMPSIVKRAIDNARNKSLPLEGESEGALPPQMPKKLPKLIQHLTKNVPEVCRPAVANAVFPSLAAHLNGVKFWLIDGTEKEATFMCVTMAKQSSGKSAVNKPIEYIVADIVERDELNRKREQEWKEASANKAANKEKPKRPDDLCVQVLVSDMTNAAFVQRMKDANGRYLYTNLEELDLLKQLQTNGTKDVGKIICLCFDNGKYGQERVGTQSVTARVDIRWNWNASSTIQKGMQFFKGRMVDGTLSRVNFCTIVPDKSKPFVYGHYDEEYAEVLKPYITNLNLANGHVECKQALELARRLSDSCADVGALSDDDIYQDMAHRAVTIAYLKAMVLYIANDMTWTKDIADFAEWSLEYDLWCKTHFFGEQVKEEKAKEQVKKARGRKNLLELLPTSFTLQEAQEVRHLQGMDEGGCRQMINSWTFRGYIEYDPTLSVYIKTEKYLARGDKS